MSAKDKLTAIYAAQPTLAVAWANDLDGTPNIYVGQTANTGVLSLTNGLGNTINLVPTSSIEIDFNGLLAGSEIGQITLSSPQGWKATAVRSASGRQVLSITPLVSQLNPDDTLELGIASILCSDSLLATWVTVTVNGVTPPPTLSSTGYNVLMQVANPPQTNNQALNLNADFMTGAQVLIGASAQPVTNALQLYFANPNPISLQPDGTGSQAALFQLNFLFDNQAQIALATLTEGQAFTVTQATGTSWTIGSTSLFPSWMLTPPAGAVLGPYLQVDSMVSFTIGNIVTSLPPGVSMAVVSYWNLAGFNDGQFAIPITKANSLILGPATLSGIDSTIPAGVLSQSGTLQLSVQNATLILVTNTPYVNSNPPTSCTDQISLTVSTPTTYTVMAFNNGTGQLASQSISVSFTDNTFQAPVGTILMWQGDQSTIPSGWAVCNGQNNTPNLVGQFIQGADPAQEGKQNDGSVGNSGGPDQHTHYLAANSLSGTALSAGQHKHQVSVPNATTTMGGNNHWGGKAGTYSTTSAGAHSHSVSVSIPANTILTAVQDTDSLMRPAWYALYFIMRVT